MRARIRVSGAAPIVGFATNPAVRVGYIERRGSMCSIHVGSVALAGPTSPSHATVRPVVAIRGGVVDDVDARPSLSPDGRRLALVVSSGPRSSGTSVGRDCGGPDRIVVVDVADGSQRVWSGSATAGSVTSLEWAPDSRRLAFFLSGDVPDAPGTGTHVLDIDARGSSYLRTRLVLSADARDHPDDPAYGPVFWWHGLKVVVEGGALMFVEHHRTVASRGLHPPVGLPADVRSVSVAAGGTDLLLQDGQRETWWWDGSVSRRVPDPARGHWVEPAW